MTVEITITESGKIRVASPYNPEFPARARKLGGRWNASAKTWEFDARDEERVRELCRDVYGTDGTDAGETVTVRVKAREHSTHSDTCGALYVGPVQVARAFDRDGGARLGDNVVVIEGSVGSGGSRKNWYTIATDAVLEIRDLPRGVADAVLADSEWDGEIVGEPTVDRAALEAERARLAERMAEIDALLAE